MINVLYTSTFIRQLRKLEQSLQEEVVEKVKNFKKIENHQALKVHKLSGGLKAKYSFSVNYKYRILFQYGKSKDTVYLMGVGDHDIYN